MRDLLNTILARHTGQSMADVQLGTDRDYYMSAEEAKTYGIIDEVLQSRGAVDVIQPKLEIRTAEIKTIELKKAKKK